MFTTLVTIVILFVTFCHGDVPTDGNVYIINQHGGVRLSVILINFIFYTKPLLSTFSGSVDEVAPCVGALEAFPTFMLEKTLLFQIASNGFFQTRTNSSTGRKYYIIQNRLPIYNFCPHRRRKFPANHWIDGGSVQ